MESRRRATWGAVHPSLSNRFCLSYSNFTKQCTCHSTAIPSYPASLRLVTTVSFEVKPASTVPPSSFPNCAYPSLGGSSSVLTVASSLSLHPFQVILLCNLQLTRAAQACLSDLSLGFGGGIAIDHNNLHIAGLIPPANPNIFHITLCRIPTSKTSRCNRPRSSTRETAREAVARASTDRYTKSNLAFSNVKQ